ncbi:DgyrCDS11520 [Dimorphilus gyrociliatus]|uniref:Peroxiredoxin-5 n=1 Tax=Dimorphilus gyrociliatus TaxID=2664684 RepID=A0A7I8W5F3_9ANNE|nr:DgyrCDS11520 [Dimorphilus gyrociliatus]
MQKQQTLQEGDKLPNLEVSEGEPGSKFYIGEVFAKGKGVLFAVPGAFTPGCDKKHLPGYVENYSKFIEKGITTIACLSVNDAFVMDAWGKHQGADGKIRMFADADGEFTKAIDMQLDLTNVLGNVRSKRYAMYIQDGVVKKLLVESDGTGLSCSLAVELLKHI